jgi:hypothetical protein
LARTAVLIAALKLKQFSIVAAEIVGLLLRENKKDSEQSKAEQ